VGETFQGTEKSWKAPQECQSIQNTKKKKNATPTEHVKENYGEKSPWSGKNKKKTAQRLPGNSGGDSPQEVKKVGKKESRGGGIEKPVKCKNQRA